MEMLPSPIIDHIAGLSGIQHAGFLSCVNRDWHAHIAHSWSAWTMIGSQICGSDHWDRGIARWTEFSRSITPPQFTRLMTCPWSQSPHAIELFPSAASALFPPNTNTRAWRILLRNEGCDVTAQSIGPSGGFWFYDEDIGDSVNTTYSIQPHSKAVDCITPTECTFDASDWSPYLNTITHDVRYSIWGDTYGIASMRYTDSCWPLHAGVIVAAFADEASDMGGLGFFGTHTRRLLHFMLLPGEINASPSIMMSLPGEMWVLERWAEPDSRLMHYGPGLMGRSF